MKAHLLRLWETTRDRFWFVPSIMATAATLLSWLTLWLDTHIGSNATFRGMNWIYITGTEGSRALLASIAGSMVTVTGVVFSITTVALSLASQQMGPRLLRNFMRDIGNQVVLGSFIATFLYSLLVLRTVHGTGAEAFVPRLSLLCAVGLSVASLDVLIYFIHHVAVSFQAPTVIESVGRSFLKAVDALCAPETAETATRQRPPDPESVLPLDFEARSAVVTANRVGYLQAVDDGTLLALAAKHDLVLRIDTRPGHFVLPGEALASVYPQERSSEDLHDRVGIAFVLGGHRTPTQDVEYVLDQLVEVAVRALSPGINDPFTALSCIDWLTAGLRVLAQNVSPSTARFDESGALRVVLPLSSFEGLAAAALNQLRQHSRHDVAVTCRLLENILRLVDVCHNAHFQDVLSHHAAAIYRNSLAWHEEADRLDAERRYLAVQDRLACLRQHPDQEPHELDNGSNA